MHDVGMPPVKPICKSSKSCNKLPLELKSGGKVWNAKDGVVNIGSRSCHVNKDGEHALFAAVRYGTLQVVKALVNAGLDVNLRNRKGEQAVDVCDLELARGRSIRKYLQCRPILL